MNPGVNIYVTKNISKMHENTNTNNRTLDPRKLIVFLTYISLSVYLSVHESRHTREYHGIEV